MTAAVRMIFEMVVKAAGAVKRIFRRREGEGARDGGGENEREMNERNLWEVEKAEKIQERILKLKEAKTKKAESKRDSKKIEKAKKEEEEARAVLKKIQDEKNRLTTEKKREQELAREREREKEKKRKRVANYREKYSVNEAFLFSVGNLEDLEETEKSLNKGVLPESLRVLFAEHGLPLSADAVVTKDSLFNWNRVPGEDDKKFLKSLIYYFGIIWAKDAEIAKSRDRRTIRISKDEKSALISTDETGERVTLRVSGEKDSKILNLKIKNENGELTDAYRREKENEWEITDFEEDEETEKFILRKEEGRDEEGGDEEGGDEEGKGEGAAAGGVVKLNIYILFAAVVIEELDAASPPTYRVWEPRLRRKENEDRILRDIKRLLYDTIGRSSTEETRKIFLERRLKEIIKEIIKALDLEKSQLKLLKRLNDYINSRVFFGGEELDPVVRESTVEESMQIIRESSSRSIPKKILKKVENNLRRTLNECFVPEIIRKDFLSNKVQKLIEEHYPDHRQDRRLREKLIYYINRDFIGFGKLDPIMNDKKVEDISVDGPNIPLYIFHREYDSIKTNLFFEKAELDAMIYKLAQRAGRHISLAKPLLNASLPNNDRLQLSLGGEITTSGSTFTIRKFREKPLTPIDLINSRTFSAEMIAYLWMAVEKGFNILIAGGTASGKTTTLNAVAMFIPAESKIVSIEDTREINLSHENWIPDVTREVEEGMHSISMFDLLKAALRQRPEYILVGEVRGEEARTLFQAMATGHTVISTVHADSPEAVVKRLTNKPIDVPLMLLDSLDIILIQRSVKICDKSERRCVQISEVVKVKLGKKEGERGELITKTLFQWEPSGKVHFEGVSKSKILAEIKEREESIESEADLSREFDRRVNVLKRMKKSVTDFKSLTKFIVEDRGEEWRA